MGIVANLVVRIQASTAGFEKELAGVEGSWKRTGARLQAIGGNLTRAVTLPLAGIGIASLRMSTDFETAMTKVRTLASESESNVAMLRDAVLQLAPTVGIGPTALADALLAIESTGFRGADALSILEASAKASAVGMGSATEIARAITAAVNAYGIENLSAAQAADILFATVDAGGAEATELAGELGRVVGIASQLGINFQQVGAFIATYTRLGLSAAEATTGLSGVMNTILSPSAQAREALAGVGLSAEQLRTIVREQGLEAALALLTERLRGNADATGAVFGNVRALAGVLGTAGTQGETYRQILDQITNSTNVLNERFAIWRTTTAATWSEFTAQAQVAAIQLGQALAPAMSQVLQAAAPVLDAFIGLVNLFTSLPVPIQTTVIGVLAFGAALGPITYAIGSIFTAGSSLIGLFTGFPAVMTAVAAAFRLITPFLGPAGLIITGVTAIFLAWKNWDAISAIVQNVYTAVKTWMVDRFNAIVESIRQKVAAVTGFFKGMYDSVVGHSYVPDMMNRIGQEFGRLDSLMVAPARSISQAMNNIFDSMASSLSKKVQDMVSGIGGMFSGLLGGLLGGGIGSLLSFGIEKLGGALGNLFSGGEEAKVVNPARDQFLSQFGGAGTGAGSGFGALAARLTDITGQHGGGQLFQALTSADTDAEFQSAKGGIEETLAQHGGITINVTAPSSEQEYIKGAVTKGVLEAIGDNKSGAFSTFERLVSESGAGHMTTPGWAALAR